MSRSALESAKMAEDYGLPRDHIILSAKLSGVQDLIDVYRTLAERCDYALHLGLTEAGMGAEGNRGIYGGHCRSAAGRNRRYDPSFPDSRSGRRSHRGSICGAADPAVARDPEIRAAGIRMSRMRPHQFVFVSGDGGSGPDLYQKPDAGLEKAIPRC